MEYKHVIVGALLMLLVLSASAFVKPRSLPSAPQAIFEAYIRFVRSMLRENMGEKGDRYLPIIASIGLFILISNIAGMIPGVPAPTANANTNFAIALSVFLLYNFEGFRAHGIGYLKHFAGPNPYLAPFFFVIEVVSHLSRPVTLTLRLFANIKGGSLLIAVLVSLALKSIPALVLSPILLVPIMAIKLFAAFIQAYIFMILSTVYLASAVEEH
ncbi:MAG: F0F1 ATP synthase subunit A [Aquificaceae bacterium]|nr:F0F1 ATP synthase subunit A [Aquificaceae bacterium]